MVLRKLSLEFTKEMYRDAAKIYLMPGKIICESICIWPDSDALYIKIFQWLHFCNLLLCEILCLVYFTRNISDIAAVVAGGITVITNTSTLVRLYTMISNTESLNDILFKIWKQFWPLKLAEVEKQKNIRNKSKYIFLLIGIIYFFGGSSNVQYSLEPVLRKELILTMLVPFRWDRFYVYEILYIWEYYIDWYFVFVTCAFDIIFVALLNVCYIQYAILQDVVESILKRKSKEHREIIFGEKGKYMTDSEMLFECLKQHKLLIEVCNALEEVINKPMLVQLAVTVGASCSAAIVMKLDSSQLPTLSGYCVAHLLQLFSFCFVGQQLIHESSKLSDAIYNCDWHLGYDRNFRKSLLMMIQRSQTPQSVTAVGLFELNFDSFVRVVKFTFSIYTLLDTFLPENRTD